jgi:aspartate/methionine/tyrosine aminotransferase
VSVLPVDGGWSAVLRFPAVIGEEELVLTLLAEDGVAVQPGFFFDFPRDGYLVLSLLPAEEVFDGGIARVLARVHRLL